MSRTVNQLSTCSHSNECARIKTSEPSNRPVLWPSKVVPSTVSLSEALRSNTQALGGISLIPLNCTFGVVNEKDPTLFKTALKKEARLTNGKRADVSVVFVVRRPGCVGCREHGLQLSELAKELNNVSFWGIVKETGVEEEGLLTFQKDYFPFPLYKDEKWMTYKVMGNRKLSPLKAIKRAFEARGRWAKKGIANQYKAGDIWVQGGVLIFRKGELRHVYEEDYGRELDIDEIREAIRTLSESKDVEDHTSSEASEGSFKFQSVRTEI